MAKDDYEVIVFRILTYLYAILKRKTFFDADVFKGKIIGDISDEYVVDVLRMLQDEALIEGVVVKRFWGTNYMLISDPKDIIITANGIRYLKENSTMQKLKELFKEMVGIIGDLVRITL